MVEPTQSGGTGSTKPGAGRVRPELADLLTRRSLLSDDARADAVAARHAQGRRTARESLDRLLDPGSWVEYGALAVAGQRSRRAADELRRTTQADGLVAGIGSVNRSMVGSERAACAVLSYDYLVLAGTQGLTGHRKTDRLLDVVRRRRLPVVFFTEGGGGRPGDTDYPVVAGLHLTSFALWAQLSGVVPRIAVASGRCFAGNAAMFGSADVTIATRGSSIGMGGPAMIEAAGLGAVDPTDVGPAELLAARGVVDVLVDGDDAAVDAARQVLEYFQGPVREWSAPEQSVLRDVVPAHRRRAYDVREAIGGIADIGTVLELRREFGRSLVTAFARIEGRPVGVLANQPLHQAGAITSEAADKGARFLQLCDAFGLPVLSLVDTPGIMVGPEAEATGLVRHAARLFTAGANLRVPLVAVVLRKAYGLGAMAMAGGSFHQALATVAWPTGEIGGMGLEGAVRLGYRREIAAVEDPEERAALVDRLVAAAYEQGRAVSAAESFELDDVIDPADTRHWISTVLLGAAVAPPRAEPVVDTW